MIDLVRRSMRIVCPSCEATYNVPEATLGAAARDVRCARCSTVWQVDPTPAEVIEPPPEVDLPPPITIPPDVPEPDFAPQPMAATHRLPTTGKSSSGIAALAIAWLASFAILGAAAWAAVEWRAAIMQAWEPSKRLYQWLGWG